MKQWIGVALGALVLAGCASSGKGGTEAVVQVQEDKATQVKTVAFAPLPMDCGRVAHCPTLGVRWSSTAPNRATLLVGTWGGQAQIEAIEFNARPHAPLRVRSKAKDASGLPGVTAFEVPMDTLERVALGSAAWVRLTTTGAVIEENLYSGERSSRAADALKRLMYEAYKGTDKELSLGLIGVFTDKPYEPNYYK